MNVQDLLNQIQELGYRFELVGDGIKFTYTRGSQTPKEAIPILRHFKERKQEVVNHLQEQSKIQPLDPADRFTESFNNTLDKINAMYKPGTLDYVRKQFPKTYQKGIEVENRINRLWGEGKDLNTFKLAVAEWRDIELQLIKLFQDKQ